MDSTSAVSWVGEISRGGKTQPTFGEVNMRAKKLKAITAISNTLLNESGVNLEGWISEDLMRKTRIALDSAMLNGTGTLYQPLGLANNSDVQVTGSSSTALALTTPNDMVALLQQANVKLENVHWLLNPIGESWLRNKAFTSGPFAWSDEMARTGKLRGFDFHSSSTVAYNPAASPAKAYADFWLGDFSEMMFGVARDITIEISKEGSFTDNGATISAFDQDLTLVRLITECDFACRQPKAFVHGTFAEK
jgi:HK97 family phage major capsid protein